MKKFTKMLGRRPHEHGQSQPSAPPPFEAPTRHQLSSSNRGRPLRVTPPPSTHIVVDADPCETCAGIDFPRLLDWRPGQMRPWVGLSHVLDDDDEDGTCPYCVFFRALLGGGSGGGAGNSNNNDVGTFAPYLRIRLAFERLGIPEKHVLSGAVLIEVRARNKSLPWGYVVKTAEEEEDGYWDDTREIRGRVVPGVLDAALARSWIRFCAERHLDDEDECVRWALSVEGMTLVDVETRRVVAVEHLDTNRPDYVTLSYVRDGSDTHPSPPPPSELGDDGVLSAQLPPLMADAMVLTRDLGYRYLWVDRYCLLGERRRRQLDDMGDILGQAALTLVVPAGGVDDGIPGVSVPREPQLSLKTETGLFTTSLPRPDLEVAASDWSRCCWSFQEGLLSRRRLVLTPSQMYFQCGAVHCHESLSIPLALARAIRLGRIFPPHEAGTQPSHLEDRIAAYMARPQTCPSPARHDAFRGILHHYRRPRLPDLSIDNFLALPLPHPDIFTTDRVVSETDRLAVALGWTTDSKSILRHGLFPSWTWLSWYSESTTTTTTNPRWAYQMWSSSPLDHVSAPPEMEMSVGFDDGVVLSWEIDGDAIARRGEDAVRFLRVRSYVFAMVARRDAEGDVALEGVDLAGAVKEWFVAMTPEDDVAPYKLTGVVLSGRNWRGGEDGERLVTILLCRLDGDDRLVRLGVVTLPYRRFETVDDEMAVLEGLALEAGDADVPVALREVDIY